MVVDRCEGLIGSMDWFIFVTFAFKTLFQNTIPFANSTNTSSKNPPC
jgi:hypothetical protein